MLKKLLKLFTKSDSTSFAQYLDWGAARWMGAGYIQYSGEGYNKNVVVYHCINSIADSVANVPYKVMINGEESENGPVNALLRRPNPTQSYKAFMHNLILHRMISGNCYILGQTVSTGRVMQMKALRPDRVTIMADIYWNPYKFLYSLGTMQEYPIDPITGFSDVLHIKNTNPLDDVYGLSPIAAAAMSVDQHNEAAEWNKKLLQNSAKPAGILTMKDKGDNAPPLTQAQIDLMSNMLNEKFTGPQNAGRIPVLSYDMVFQQLGMTPSDMDWLAGRVASARDICLAFKYPSMLLGLPEGATFNNVDSAKQQFYLDNVIPLTIDMLEELSWWLSTHFKQDIEIVPLLDDLPALALMRDMQRATNRLDVQAGIMTVNEARETIDLEEMPGGDDLMVPAGNLPLSYTGTESGTGSDLTNPQADPTAAMGDDDNQPFVDSEHKTPKPIDEFED